jgi:hypothetical protein
MPVTIPCPHCQRQLRIDEAHFSKRIRCPACKKRLTATVSPSSDLRIDVKVRPHRGATILTLGILGLVFAWCPLAGWILSGYAMQMGSDDLKAMDAGVMDGSHREWTELGRILGHVAAILSSVAAIVLGCLLFAYLTRPRG